MKTFLGSLVILLVVAAVLAGIGYAKYLQIDAAMNAPPPPEMPVAVSFVQPSSIRFRSSTTVVGSVLAAHSIEVRTEQTGIIAELPMQPGGHVRAGDLLLQLDSRVEQAELAAARARASIAERTYQRLQQAANAESIGKLELEQAAAAVDVAAAEVERLEALIAKRAIHAPFDATVGLFDLHVGQYLNAGDLVTTLQSLESYRLIDFALPQHVADAIAVGDQVAVQLDVALAAEGARSAEIIATDAVANRTTRSLMVRARLDDAPAALQPGDSVKLLVEYGPVRELYALPATAIRRAPTGTFVYVANAEDGQQLRARMTPIEVAGARGDFAAITSGIGGGETIVADGSFKVTEGALVAGATLQP